MYMFACMVYTIFCMNSFVDEVTHNRSKQKTSIAFCCMCIGQLLSYVIVIDFESTCWENKKGQQEISKRA